VDSKFSSFIKHPFLQTNIMIF